jgi:hypothetical protein
MDAGQQKAHAHDGSGITLYFRPAQIEYDQAECRCEIVFYSAREFIMHSPAALDFDTMFSFRMLVPLLVAGNPVCETKGTGRVIGERHLPDGTRGYIIRIE